MYNKSALTEHILSCIALQPDDSLLDVGCGNGEMLSAVSRSSEGALFFGIDMMSDPIQRAESFFREEPKLRFVTHNVEEGLPCADRSFECVICCNVLECIKNKDNLLQEMSRVLKTSGRIVISHFDYDTIVFNVKNREIYRKIIHAYSDWKQPWMAECDPWTGRKLWGILNRVSNLFSGNMQTVVLHETEFREGTKGFSFVKDELSDLVRHDVITSSEYAQFSADVENYVKQKEYFFSINLYTFVGDKTGW